MSEPALDIDVFGPDWWHEHRDQLGEGQYRNWHSAYGKGGLFWSYGGTGTFLSAGLLEKVQSDYGGGWERCTEVFGVGFSTDIQVTYYAD